MPTNFPGMITGLSFRRAGPADAGAIRAITRQAYAKWINVIGREPLPMTFDYDKAVLIHRIEMAELNGAIAGLIELVEEPDHLLIENLAVSPEHQNAGIGGALLKHAEALAAGSGRHWMRLYTNGLFAANIRFYAARGYTVSREEPFRGGMLVHMEKQLA